jgi:LPS-assembly protein
MRLRYSDAGARLQRRQRQASRMLAHQNSRIVLPAAVLAIVAAFLAAMAAHAAPQAGGLPASSMVRMEADQQKKEGDLYVAAGNVQVRYQEKLLRADHADYNSALGEVQLAGHVQFDAGTQHIESDQGRYNIKDGTGTFTAARGTVQPPRGRSNPMVLVSTNPVYFEAQAVDRIDESTYRLHSAWMTVCLPDRPTWKFFAAEATVHIDDRVALINSNFRILRVPLFYTPYASVPIGSRLRQSGFTVPDISNATNKGIVLGDSFYWAPRDWLDAELGAELYSRRGWAQYGDLRARPTSWSRINYSYYGVQDRGLPGPNGRGPSQSGHQSRFFAEAGLPHGWRAVADVNELSSLVFRLAFATSYTSATNAEVVSAGFLTNNFRGYSLNFSAAQYRNFLSVTPGNVIQLRKTPEVRFDSVEQRHWTNWPVYFGFDAFSGALHRSDPLLTTPTAVERSEVAPRVTVPLHFGSWLGVTTSATGRATDYGAQLVNGAVSNQSFVRTTGEFTEQIETPVLERAWGDESVMRWKHTVEPDITYNLVTGVRDFSRFLRFDQYDTLTDTNDVEYGITQRLFRKRPKGSAEQFLYWRVAQKYFFDPTFGGAIVPGRRNVFAALSSFTPFAFADGPRRWSPIVSDARLSPGGRYDVGITASFDPVKGQLIALGTTANIHPYRDYFVTLSHFDVRSPLQTKFNQLGVRAGWGAMNRKGLNFITSMNYDLRQGVLQQQAFQVSYNGSCCGLSFEYRRLALGPVTSQNEFRVALLIANFGSFGTLRRQERLF